MSNQTTANLHMVCELMCIDHSMQVTLQELKATERLIEAAEKMRDTVTDSVGLFEWRHGTCSLTYIMENLAFMPRVATSDGKDCGEPLFAPRLKRLG